MWALPWRSSPTCPRTTTGSLATLKRPAGHWDGVLPQLSGVSFPDQVLKDLTSIHGLLLDERSQEPFSQSDGWVSRGL